MNDNNVQYTLSLRDLMTSKLKEANVAATALESTMGILGVAAGAFAGMEFLKSSVEEFNAGQQASAQLTATLESTANAANLNREALDAQATALRDTTLFDDDAITHTQGLLATFTNIKDVIFMDAVPAIADLAQKMGGDLQGATMQVGKALNDPIQGMTALRRTGISFSESQQAVIKRLQETGHMAEAQKMILTELNKEVGGSAVAAAQTGTGAYTILQHQMGDVKKSIGGIVVAIGNELLPMFRAMVVGSAELVQGLKDGWTWVKENQEVFKSLAVGVAAATAAYLVYNTVTTASVVLTELMTMWKNRETIATNIATAAQWLFNAAIEANPIGLLVTAIGLAAAGFYLLYQKSEPFRQSITMLKDDAMIAGYALKWMYDKARGDAAAATEDMAKMNELLAERKSIIDGTYNSHKGELVTGGTPFSMLLDKKQPIPKGKKGDNGMDGVAEKKPDKAKGSQAITINISINKLIESFKVETTNIQESTAKIQELVANTLLSAVNDASITANI